jgi:hypothetical protein
MSMAFTEALRLVVDADTRGAVQSIENLGRTTDRELSRSTKSLDQWGSRLTKAGTGMIALGGAALVGLGSLAKASEEAHLAQLKLQNTIDNAPKLAGESADQFTDLADSIQKVTAADADQIVEAEAMLGTFQLTANEIKNLTPLVVDYARKFGVDMVSAATQVGKALDGNSAALKRNGVSIDETLFATDRYAAVQKALSEQVGGFAEAEGKTFAGSLERMKNELGDLAEGVGGGAVDAFTTMFGAVEKVADALESVSPGAQSAIGKFATFGAVGLVAVGGFNVLVGTLINLRGNISKVGEGVSGLTQKMGGLRTIVGVGGLATALAAVSLGIEEFNDHQQAMNIDRMTKQFLAAGNATGEMQAAIETLQSQGFAELLGTFDRLNQSNREAAERFIEAAEAAGVSETFISHMRDALETTAAAEKQTATDTEAATGAIDEQTGAYDELTGAVTANANALRAQFDPMFAAVNSSRALADANTDVIAKEMELAAAIQEHGAGSAEAMAAEQALTRAREDASGAALDQEVALSQLVDMVREQPGALDDAKAKLQEWVAQGWITQATADATAAKFDEVTGAANQIPAAKNTVITAHDEASGVIRVVQERVDALTGKTIFINAVASYPVPGYQTFGGRQAGGGVVPGYFQSGGVNWNWGRGPRGGDTVPAWLTPGEMILNQRQQSNLFRALDTPLMGGMSGGGGGGVIEVHSHVYLDGREVAESVRKVVQMDHGGNVQNALGYSR